MTAKFFAILTTLGAAKLANATALGTKLDLTQMSVGDGGGTLPTPDSAQTALKGERRRAAINMLSVDQANPNQIIAEQVIPENEGGWWIREIGLFDKDGTLIAVANCPETYKPQLQEGSGRTQTIRMVLIVSSTEAVTLKIDPSVVLATRDYVDNAITAHAKSRNHPDASTGAKGFVQLSSAIDSTSEVLAATPKAAKTAYDLANGKISKTGDSLTGILKTSAEIQSTSQNNYRIISGGYGSFWRQDVTGLYLLLTAENDPYGSYGPLRPLRVDIKTGDLTFGESVTIGKTLRAAQVWDNNQRVYSPNNKPTAADVGALERTDFPVGIPQPWSTTTPPTGWLKCNGAAFDRAKYPLLAVAYPTGTLPDLRGEFVRGWDDGRGIDSGRGILGAQSDELRSHRHLKLNVDTSGVAYGLGAGNFSNQQTGGFYANTSIGFDSGTPGIGTGPTGGAETRPRNIAFNYIVRAA